MKKMRLPLIITLGLFIILLILGSFLDLKISNAIASSTNNFGLAISILAPTVGFGGMCILGGGFIAFAIKGDYKTLYKVCFIILAIALYAGSIVFAGGEYFGLNGFYKALPEWAGYLICALPLLGFECLGYFLFKDNQNKNLWIVFIILIIAGAIALGGFCTVFKSIFHRPRYRILSQYEIEFHSWWQRCKNYKELMANYNIDKENFKSFPSGHTTEIAMLLLPLIALPLANKKYEKIQLPLFFVTFGLILLVGFSRILCGAHFLSDVSMGALLMVLFTLIANEIIIRNKKLQLDDIINN